MKLLAVILLSILSLGIGLLAAFLLPVVAIAIPFVLSAVIFAYLAISALSEFEYLNDDPLLQIKRDWREAKILIIEDDEDMAEMLAEAYQSAGFKTVVSNGHDSPYLKIAFGNYDLILLGWRLGKELDGDKVLKMADNVIQVFPDLKKSFGERPPALITLSARPSGEIGHLNTDNFLQIDHWQKPYNFERLKSKAINIASA